MKIRKILAAILLGAVCMTGSAAVTFAAFNADVENAYNLAVQAQDALDGLDVTVEEKTVSSLTNISSCRTTDLKVSGISSNALYADITISADEDCIQNYYRSGYYYETIGTKKIKTKMDRSEIWNKINSLIYLDMSSKDLTMLYSQKMADGSTSYQFAADEVSLGDYADKLLDAYSCESGAKIESLQGNMVVSADGHVIKREISLIYSVSSGQTREVFHKIAAANFRQNGSVQVALPDLSAYHDPNDDKPAVTLTPCYRTVYAVADLNVRSAGSLEAAVIGGYPYAGGMTQTAYTSDGWVQIQYNGGTGYVWNSLVSTQQPVTTKDNHGIMYAVCNVNIRESWNADSIIKGVLSTGESIEITGTTSNGWTRVLYKGERGYVYSDYLTWSEPVDPNYVENAMMYGPIKAMNYGMITLERPDGTDIILNTSYASISVMDTLEIGDVVQVVFSGAASPYTASKIVDTTTHYVAASSAEEEFDCDGVVVALSGRQMEVSCLDGVYRTFDLSKAMVMKDEPLVIGSYVIVTWMGTDENKTKDLKAKEIS